MTVGKLMGGVLLVSGTTIGAAMLALPVATGFAGFIPSVVLFVACWLYFTYTALLMLEVNLWFGDNVNLITMANRTIGRWGEFLSWLIFLLLLYALTTAYVAGSGSIMITFIAAFTGYTLPAWFGPFPLILLFGYFVYRGTKHVDYLNRIFMIGLGVSFLLMIALLIPQVDLPKLTYTNWPMSWMGISIVATSFGYHIIIPSLTTYFESNVRLMRLSILIGSLFPLVGYIIWNGVSLGVIPITGYASVTEGFINGDSGATLLVKVLNEPIIGVIASFFAFFAIVTSFLGVALSLTDFLADGFKIKSNGKGRLIVCLLEFIPPLALTLTDPRAFLSALEFAGAFCVVTLLGLIPALMVWYGRYYRGYDKTHPYRAPGGRISLVVVMLIAAAIFLLELGIKTELIR
jgi:tyrosine-specific transport protein